MMATELPLIELVGRWVRTTREFSGIPVGTTGVVVEHYANHIHEGITVEWRTIDGPEGRRGAMVRDGFGRDTDFDETQWLEVLD